jgi:putative transposase
MANTYTQIHIQVVFSVKYRLALISQTWKDELFQYMTGIIQSYKHKVLIINGIPDHIHILIGMRPHQSLSSLMQEVKGSSSKWINERNFTSKKFEWQKGFGAFSYAPSQVQNVLNYILNQEKHHQTKAFANEYVTLLKKFKIDYVSDIYLHR